MKALLILMVAALAACAETSQEALVRGLPGKDGTNGTACTISQQEGGALLSCTDETSFFVHNGTDGQDGADGQDGTNGQDGLDGLDGTIVSLATYSVSSCMPIAGTSYYAKKTGTSIAFYISSACSGSKSFEMTAGDSFWVSSTALAVYLTSGLRVIDIGGA